MSCTHIRRFITKQQTSIQTFCRRELCQRKPELNHRWRHTFASFLCAHSQCMFLTGATSLLPPSQSSTRRTSWSVKTSFGRVASVLLLRMSEPAPKQSFRCWKCCTATVRKGKKHKHSHVRDRFRLDARRQNSERQQHYVIALTLAATKLIHDYKAYSRIMTKSCVLPGATARRPTGNRTPHRRASVPANIDHQRLQASAGNSAWLEFFATGALHFGRNDPEQPEQF